MSSDFVDNRTYATVVYSDHSLQYTLSVIINIIATPIHLTGLYIILTQSKRETLVFKVGLLCQQFFFFISMIIWGGLAGLVFTHPFPAMYCVGILKNYVNCLPLFLIWMVSFEAYFFGYLMTNLIRLKVMCRPGKAFDFKNRTYYLIIVFMMIYCFIPMNCVVLSDYATHDEMRDFVAKYYPNNMKIFENPGVYVQIHPMIQKVFLKAMLCYICSGLPIVIFFNSSIYYEISKRSLEGSKTFVARKALLNQLARQSIGLSVFIFISCLLMLSTVLNPPEVDSRLQKTIGSVLFCGSCIPAQLFLICTNSAYRNYVLKKVRRQSVFPQEDRGAKSVHRTSIKSTTVNNYLYRA